MRSRVVVVLMAGSLAATAGAASTKFVSKWSAPDAGPLNFKDQKVVGLVMAKDEDTRFSAEAALAREITAQGALGIAGYTQIPKELTRDQAQAKAFLEKANVKGVVVMRAVKTDKEITSSPSMGYWGSPYYSSFWGPGFYGTGWASVYDPGYIREDTIVSIETLIYSLPLDKLVWAGMSKTTNPDNLGKLIKELVTTAAKEMRKAKLIR